MLNCLVKIDALYKTECKKIKIESNISGGMNYIEVPAGDLLTVSIVTTLQ
jgi:hypothetical protein